MMLLVPERREKGRTVYVVASQMPENLEGVILVPETKQGEKGYDGKKADLEAFLSKEYMNRWIRNYHYSNYITILDYPYLTLTLAELNERLASGPVFVEWEALKNELMPFGNWHTGRNVIACCNGLVFEFTRIAECMNKVMWLATYNPKRANRLFKGYGKPRKPVTPKPRFTHSGLLRYGVELSGYLEDKFHLRYWRIACCSSGFWIKSTSWHRLLYSVDALHDLARVNRVCLKKFTAKFLRQDKDFFDLLEKWAAKAKPGTEDGDRSIAIFRTIRRNKGKLCSTS